MTQTEMEPLMVKKDSQTLTKTAFQIFVMKMMTTTGYPVSRKDLKISMETTYPMPTIPMPMAMKSRMPMNGIGM